MDHRQSTLASASIETGQTTIRASVLNEQVIEVAPGWVGALEGALPHARYRAIALYDARGEVLHCTSTDFGIEFRQALNDALDAFVLGAARESRFLRGEGTRTAIMLALRDLNSALQGVCLLVVEDTPLEDEDPASRFLTPAVQTILADVASEIAQTLHAIPAQKPQKAKPPVPLPLEAVYAQIREQEVVLRVQQLVRLRKAEGVRRFEVLLRHMVDGEEQSPERVMQTAANHGLASMIDRRVIGELIGWLHRNPTVWKKDSAGVFGEPFGFRGHRAAFHQFRRKLPAEVGSAAGSHRRGILRARVPHASERSEAGAGCVRAHRRAGGHRRFQRGGRGHAHPRSLGRAPAQAGLPSSTTNALQHRLTQARVVGLVQTAKVMGLQTGRFTQIFPQNDRTSSAVARHWRHQ